ncbi:MAG TPA: HAD-IC family P-type ATPase [Candidatus Saccharimonadales bacterium]|nr:HAD-IC family P-type ATPase [Candidatus Saccharimonadales bacterium]
MDNSLFYQLSIATAFKKLAAKPSGLETLEIDKRLQTYGLNKLPRKKALTGLRLFLGQFKNPLVFILLAALVISFFAGHKSDSLIILIVVMVTNVVGFLQEWKANNALEKLNQAVTHKIKVWRNNQLTIIKRDFLVPGDIIEIAAGDVVPADARVFEAKDLKINEAALTGESFAVDKSIKELTTEVSLADRKNMIYQGTIVADGYGKALVTATGQNTEIGKIAKLIKETSEGLTPLQKQINSFGVKLGLFLIVINVVIFLIGVISGRDIFEMFMISVVIVVSAVPEGLIPAMAIILAIGMQHLAKKQGLVRRAIAAETLGSVSVICADKTGTLTQGEMLVDQFITGDGIKKLDKETLALKIAVLCNDGLIENPGDEFPKLKVLGNPTDKALLLAGASVGLYRQELEKLNPRLDEILFSSESKLMATLHKLENGQEVVYVKGAPEKLLAQASKIYYQGQEKKLSAKDKKVQEAKIAEFTSVGARVIALAYKNKTSSKSGGLVANDLEDLTLVGFFSLRDQIRLDVKQAIQSCREAGIRVVIITGDNARTAMAIVKEIGLEINHHNVIDGDELDKLTDAELKKRINDIRLYARVSPHHKLRIVNAFQEIGKTVAMTGDGINDSPALKKADIGVAIGSGTDVAKEAADLVLLDNSFLTIVEAVKQGRITFLNIRKVILYLFTDCFQEMVIIGVSVLLGWPLPILPAQILWIKLIEDPLPAASLAFDVSDDNVMHEKPRNRKQPLLTVALQKVIAFYAIVMDCFALAIFYYYFHVLGDITLARTVMFATLGLSTMFYIYAVRSLNTSIFKTKHFSNKFLVVATFFGAVLIVASVYLPILNRLLSTIPLRAFDWLVVLIYGSLTMFVFEIGKYISGYHREIKKLN